MQDFIRYLQSCKISHQKRTELISICFNTFHSSWNYYLTPGKDNVEAHITENEYMHCEKFSINSLKGNIDCFGGNSWINPLF